MGEKFLGEELNKALVGTNKLLKLLTTLRTLVVPHHIVAFVVGDLDL